MNATQIVKSYHNAWTSGHVDAARAYLADDLDFQGSIDTFHRADDFIEVLSQFQKMLRGVKLIHSFFSESGAALLYDCDTPTPAGVIRTAEFFSVADGKIKSICLVFDATDLQKRMG